ncbi:MAG: DUF262 domain-containing protein [Candidatus Electrothrix sp. ATG1]|nr:DUF262 domain-containing protein [Candidatus Electrothrix sp. ATG1]
MSNSNTGKIYSFWQLLKEEKIEIPIIQRDYAQGREDKKEIRMAFLRALHKSLSTENQGKLDFVYGSKSNGVFQPLDGQQRLTTLFLLHWYASLKDNSSTNEVKEILSRFTYETRASSREFCNELVNNFVSFEEITNNNISEIITDSSWFFLSWKKDPTIDAMLRTIDDIYLLFKNIENIWEKLLSDKVLISFYHVELENFGLTDDLYIKMNARGKLLTPFENFKAIFQKYIDDNKWDNDKKITEKFGFKVDTIWADLFWRHRKNDKIDDAFIRFISTIAMIRIVLEKSENRLEKISALQSQPESIRSEIFTKQSYSYLCDYLDIYCRVYKDNIPIELEFPLWEHKRGDDIFSALVYEGNNASYTQKVLFYAQTEYIKKTNKFDKEKFICWMRVIRNIVSRGDAEKNGQRPTTIRSPESFDGVIRLINDLSEGCEDIYHFLAKTANKFSFSKDQIEEEKLKAKLIVKDDNYKNSIFTTEDISFCKGRISFALYCINYTKEDDIFNPDELYMIQKILDKYLDNEITNDFRRCLLTIADDNGLYNYYSYWWSWSHAVNANKRCLIAKYNELEYYLYNTKYVYTTKNKEKISNTENKNYFKTYLKKLILELSTKDLKDIIADFEPPADMPNWKVRLIKEPELLDKKCNSKYIAIPDDEKCCYLLRGIRPRDKDGCEKID